MDTQSGLLICYCMKEFFWLYNLLAYGMKHALLSSNTNVFYCFLYYIGILKKSSPSLEPVPEFAESHEIQRADSNLEIVESEVCGIIFKGMCSLYMYIFQLFQQI